LNKYFYFKAPKEGEGAMSIDISDKQELIKTNPVWFLRNNFSFYVNKISSKIHCSTAPVNLSVNSLQ